MKIFNPKPLLSLHIILSAIALCCLLILNFSCSKDDSVSGPPCGSGDVFFDKMANQCRDRQTGATVSATCCNQ